MVADGIGREIRYGLLPETFRPALDRIAVEGIVRRFEVASSVLARFEEKIGSISREERHLRARMPGSDGKALEDLHAKMDPLFAEVRDLVVRPIEDILQQLR
jgi:hypothetical protein